VPYEVVITTADELTRGDTASALAAANAMAKVRLAGLPLGVSAGAFVLGTDTLVTLGGRVMGKPSSAEEAGAMIATLSGRTHQVVSGVALGKIGPGGKPPTDEAIIVATATTRVSFLRLEDAQIEAYIASGEWVDKAGAYGVQGLAGTFVSGIRGEYSNVVGLPLCLLAGLFRESGFDLVRRQWI
jgi:septum formation protein